MTRPRDSWGPDPYGPRHGSYYAQAPNPQRLRLPPPSSLFNETTAAQGQRPLDERERAFYSNPAPRDVYAPLTSMSAYTPGQVPILGPERHASPTMSPGSGRPVDIRTRLSPTHSLTASDQSEDPPDPFRSRQFVEDLNASPVPRLSSQFGPVYEPQPRQLSYVDMQQMRLSQDAQSQHARMAFSSQTSSPIHQLWSPQPEPRIPEQRMKISDILSSEHASAEYKSAKASQKAPEPNLLSTAVTSTYRISIRQQPLAARSCGYGERDRRVIDPPPIIQLSIEDPTASEEEIRHRLTHSYSIMHCTIWNEAGDQDLSSMPEDYRTQRRLMGTVVSSPFAGNDENEVYGCFFCFPDLSCRTPGSFRLRFSFMVLDPLSCPGHRTPVVALVMSDVFTVYNAKDFPGMKASTALTKRLKEQGCLISIKKGNERTRTREESESEDDYAEDAEGSGSQKRLKRTRRDRKRSRS
ncbi:hypothetical protein GGR50DRAFT_689047 [Xylaria sp. CBS 124048]|nr:hypothetical protein GGR50DRAFT_689047 [Xylaria sp. CBS 124048]